MYTIHRYSADLVPLKFVLFRNIKNGWQRKRFHTDVDGIALTYFYYWTNLMILKESINCKGLDELYEPEEKLLKCF